MFLIWGLEGYTVNRGGLSNVDNSGHGYTRSLRPIGPDLYQIPTPRQLHQILPISDTHIIWNKGITRALEVR